MSIIHIQEVNSDQVTEVIAKDAKTAIRAYAKNAAFSLSDLDKYIIQYHDNKLVNGVKCAIFYFRMEKLTITNIYGNRYLAVWADL